MHAKDPREPIYRKIGKRYIECGVVSSPYLKDQLGSWEGIRKDGIWLHTSGDGFRAMTFVSTLEDLPAPITQVAALHLHRQSITTALMERMSKPVSAAELAELAVNLVAKICSQPTKQNQTTE